MYIYSKSNSQFWTSKQRPGTIKKSRPIRPYEKGVAGKLKSIARKHGFTTVFTKTKDLGGQLQTKQKDQLETSGVVYEVDYNNWLKSIQVK